MSGAVTQADRAATAEILGYSDWADATDIRLTGAQDRAVARVLAIVSRHREAETDRCALIAETWDGPRCSASRLRATIAQSIRSTPGDVL